MNEIERARADIRRQSEVELFAQQLVDITWREGFFLEWEDAVREAKRIIDHEIKTERRRMIATSTYGFMAVHPRLRP